MPYEILPTITPAAPVSIDEVKLQARIDHDTEDTLIERKIDSAVEWVESRCGIRLTPRTYRLDLPCFPCGRHGELMPILLSPVPFRSLTEVAHYDSSDSRTVLALTGFEVERVTLGHARLYPTARSWPSIELSSSRRNSIEISYEVGAEDPEAIASPIKEAVALLAAHFIECNRDQIFERDEKFNAVEFLLSPYRTREVV